MAPQWQCSFCGQTHETLPTSFSWDKPLDYFSASTADQAKFVKLDQDFCHIDDEKHFLRCTLEIPIQELEEKLVFGVWIGVSKRNFYRYREYLAEEENEPNPPPFFGVLCGVLPKFDGDDVLWSQVRVQIRPGWRFTIRPIPSTPYNNKEPPWNTGTKW